MAKQSPESVNGHGIEDILFESHEDRLQRVERALVDISSTLAQVAQNTSHMATRFDEMASDIKALKETTSASAAKEVEKELRLQTLEEDKADRKEHRKDVRKWIFGVVSAVITAGLVVLLGWR